MAVLMGDGNRPARDSVFERGCERGTGTTLPRAIRVRVGNDRREADEERQESDEAAKTPLHGDRSGHHPACEVRLEGPEVLARPLLLRSREGSAGDWPLRRPP